MTWLLLAILAGILWKLWPELQAARDIPRHLTRCPNCNQTSECAGPIGDAEADAILAEIESWPEAAA